MMTLNNLYHAELIQSLRLTKHKNLADKYNAQVINCGVIEYGLYIEKDVEDLAIQLKEFLV